jgi:hypothetical protein
MNDEPVKSYGPDRFPELVKVDRLLDIAVSPQVVTRHHVPLSSFDEVITTTGMVLVRGSLLTC